MKIKESINFDDVLLEPKYSTISSRDYVTLDVQMPEKGYWFKTPIMPANMKSVASPSVMKEALSQGSLCLLHRFDFVDDIIDLFCTLRSTDIGAGYYVGVSVGVKDLDYKNIEKYIEAGVKIFCVDIAHCDSFAGVKMTAHLKKVTPPNSLIIAGNVSTYAGAYRLYMAGADIVKAGIANGAACQTKNNTGCGGGQLTTLEECKKAKDNFEKYVPGSKKYLISDGGIDKFGDITKALCFADMVMCGRMFASCEEADNDGVYAGSSTLKDKYIEGACVNIPKLWTVSELYKKMHDGLRSGCSYLNAKCLSELHVEQTWLRVNI